MEWREPVEEKKLSKWKQNELDIINKQHSITSDQDSRALGFSHGYLILRSTSLTIFGNFLFYGLIFSSFITIVSLIMDSRPRPSFHFFHYYIPQYGFQMVFFLAGAVVLDVASILLMFSFRKRSIWMSIYFLMVFIAPMFLFHWSFMGN